MALSVGQLAGRLNNDQKRHYDAATGLWYVFQNGILVPIPYYESQFGWAAAGKITVNHNLNVIPKKYGYKIKAKAAIGNLAIGQEEEIYDWTNSTTSFNCIARKPTLTSVEVGVGAGGISFRSAGEIGTIVTPAQADIIIQVWGF